MNERGDIRIETKEGKVALHFMDIPFRFRRVLTIPRPNEYIITRVIPSRVTKIHTKTSFPNMSGAPTNAPPRVTGYEVERNCDKARKLPSIINTSDFKHVVIIDALPVDAKRLKDGMLEQLSSGDDIGDMYFYTTARFKKVIKGTSYTSIFKEDIL